MAKTILLADDSVTIQKVVELTFMDEDYQVVSTSDGSSALEQIPGLRPDLVIADVHMPGADGYEVCRQTKDAHPEIPVLLLVGTFEQFDEEKAAEVRADGHLKKPFDSQDLQSQVESLIARSGAAAPVAEATPAVAPADTDVFELGAPQPQAGEPSPSDFAPPPASDFAVPPASDFAAPPASDFAAPPASDFAAPPASDFAPPPASDFAAPPASDFAPPPASDFAPPPASDFAAPPASDFAAPPASDFAAPPPASDFAPPPASDFAPPTPEFATPPAPEPQVDQEITAAVETVAAEPGPFDLEQVSAEETPTVELPEVVQRATAVEDLEAPTLELPPIEDSAPPLVAEPVAAEPAVEPAIWGTAPEPESPKVEATPEPAVAARPAAVEESTADSANGSGPLSDDDVDRIARRVAELMGEKALRDVAWEVLPDLAEVIIRERIRELESQVV